MNREEHLIESLVAGLEPVRPMRRRGGATLVAIAFALTVCAVASLAGFRSGLFEGRFDSLFVITNGLLLVLGLSSASAVVTMANPRVGASHDSPKWAMAALALLPLAAVLALLVPDDGINGIYHGRTDWHCVLDGTASGILIAAALLLWLRRGAPVAPGSAGLYLGIASGALGMVAYGLACPVDGLVHLGVWHVIPVALLGMIGRIAGPLLVRW